MKARDLLIRQRNQAINALRGDLTELGITASRGVSDIGVLIAIVRNEDEIRAAFSAHRPVAIHLLDSSLFGRDSDIGEHLVREAKQDILSIGFGSRCGHNHRRLICTRPRSLQVWSSYADWIGLSPRIQLHSGEDLESGQPSFTISATRWGVEDLSLANRVAEARAGQGRLPLRWRTKWRRLSVPYGAGRSIPQ
ncbi:hypothetical protein ACRYWZ_18195 (plasmid) [Agrobacterium deltaense]|uniref:hypothetical protein n=1 Tax=Agrobacterium deltaense TaxID=1183412 RepID=UPI003D95FE95